MSVTATTESTSSLRKLSDYDESKTTSGSALDKNAFLQLLVAQLSNQDPLNSTDNSTEYVTQLAQFTLLEQIQQLNSTSTTTQAYNLIGKYAYVDVKGDGSSYVFGQVTGVDIEDGVANVVIGGKEYSCDNIVSVVNSSSTTLEEQLVGSAQLIGKTVTAQFTDDAENVQTVTGVVSQIIAENGYVYALVDGNKVLVGDIQKIEN